MATPTSPPPTDAATPAQTRAGFVALIGAPNSGKSTLLNALVGAKVSIVSRKVQTTRARVLGIAIEGAAQLIFVDTPGIFRPKKRLDRAMVAAAWQGAEDADLVALLVDAHANARAPGGAGVIDDDTRAIVSKLKESGRRATLVLNKVDLVNPPQLLSLADALNRERVFTDTFMISALTGDGVADVKRHFASAMPPGPWLFPEDQISDMPDRLLAAEIVREQLFERLHQELPYALTVETEGWEERKDGSVKIDATIYVQRESQRAIALGAKGERIKTIGAAARKELEALFERRVHLFLFVKVREKWQDDPERYRAMGLEWEG
jgi:GTP-binding protein Era